MKVVLCVKKEKPYLYGMYSGFESRYGYHLTNDKKVYDQHNVLNGKIVAECDYEIEDIVYKHIHKRDRFGILHNEAWYEYKELNVAHHKCDLASRSGFEDDSSLFDYLFDYLDSENGYAINTKNLSAFDKPKELSEYYTRISYYAEVEDFKEIGVFIPIDIDKFWFEYAPCKKLEKAPKKMQKIVLLNKETNKHEYAILIPISPQEACNILNHKQDTLIRRNVLKEMK